LITPVYFANAQHVADEEPATLAIVGITMLVVESRMIIRSFVSRNIAMYPSTWVSAKAPPAAVKAPKEMESQILPALPSLSAPTAF